MTRTYWISSARIVAGLFAAAMLSTMSLHAAQFADRVVDYQSGTGFATEFGTGIGYTNATVALGAPARATVGDFAGPVDPFAPPYQKEQLVSLGEGGSLTVSFRSPVPNAASHPFGIDFMIYGNSGFVITNATDEDFNYIGTPATDGSLFGRNTGASRVSVSRDNVTYYTLQNARGVDGLFPTDGAGDFSLPVDPSLTSSDFAGMSLEGIRSLYNGSGGGTGYDISSAVDSANQPVFLEDIQFVRIEVLSGTSEIDAVSAVPEPGVGGLLILGLAGWIGVWMRRRGG